MFGRGFLASWALVFVSAGVVYAFGEEHSTSLVDSAVTSSHQERVDRTLQPINYRISDVLFRQSMVNAPQLASIFGETGLAAGDESLGLNGWGNIIYSDFEDDSTGAAYDGDGTSFGVGVDKSFLDNKLIGGLSLSYDMSETNDDFGGDTDTDSFTISPYLTYMLNNTYSVDFSFGWGEGDTDIQRYDVLSQKNSGSQDSDHSFYSLGVSGSHWLDMMNLSWRVGYYSSRTNYDEYTEKNVATGLVTTTPESTNKIAQASVSFQVGYYLETWMPYAKVAYEKDTSRTKSTANNDDDGFVWEAGANIFTSGPFSGGASISARTGRGDYDNISGMARVSYAF